MSTEYKAGYSIVGVEISPGSAKFYPLSCGFCHKRMTTPDGGTICGATCPDCLTWEIFGLRWENGNAIGVPCPVKIVCPLCGRVNTAEARVGSSNPTARSAHAI